MGVTILYPYTIPDGKTGPQVIDHLSKRLLALGATHTGQFLVECESYMTAPQHGTSKIVHVVHNSEYPVTTFAFLDTGTGKHIPLIADSMFDLVIIKLTAVNTNKKIPHVESKGARFEYGDFIVKLGSVTMNENFKGVLIEVEYRACVAIILCWELLREIMESFLGIPVSKEYPDYFTPQPVVNALGQQQMHAKQNETYETIDTINQYLEQFAKYRKMNTMPGSMINVNTQGMRVL